MCSGRSHCILGAYACVCAPLHPVLALESLLNLPGSQKWTRGVYAWEAGHMHGGACAEGAHIAFWMCAHALWALGTKKKVHHHCFIHSNDG